jgi:hypothetical protein
MDQDLSRYTIVDDYILEELKRRYGSSTARERIELISGLYDNGIMPPYELALLVVDDPSVEVRQWFARHAKHLDYRDSVIDGTPHSALDELRNLAERLKEDEDEFVRACLYENPAMFSGSGYDEWKRIFMDATHMERLALVRNPNMQSIHKLLDAIFDPENTELDISLDEREQFVNALLMSRQALTENYRRGTSVIPQPWDARLFSRLWRLINKWPKDSRVQRNIYLYIGTTIKTKAGIYRQCKQPVFRADLLRSVDPDDSDTLELGMKDPDERCRFLAYAKAHNLSSARVEHVLDSSDIYALLGLAENEHLTIRQLEQIKDRLFGLGAHEEARLASETIERVKSQQPPTDPRRLFGPEGRQSRFMDDKINYIGRQMNDIRKQLDFIQELVDNCISVE